MKKLLLSALMLLSAVIVDKAYAQTPTASDLTVAPETSTSTQYKWYTMEATHDGETGRRHLFLQYDASHDPALYTVLLTDGTVDGVNLTSGGESIPDKYLWRLDQADGGVYLVNKASDLRITVPSSATNSNNTKLTMTEAGVVWSMDSPSGNTANQYCFNYTACSTTPAYMNAMRSDQSYGVTIYSAGQQRASGWFFYKAYEEVVTEKTATPVLTLASGSNIEKGVTLIPVSCATDGAVIYYTTDGSEPTERSAQAVNGNIIVDASNSDYETTITVKAAAKADGYNISNVVTATYTVKDPYGMFCTPAATTTGNKRAQTKGEILNATGVIEGSTLTFTPSGSRSNQAWSSWSDGAIKVNPGATFNLKVTYGLDGWDDLSVYQMKSSSDYTLIYGTYAGAWTQGGSTTTLFNNINAAADGATADATAGTATFPITIPEDMNNGDLLVIRFIIHSSVFNNNPCATGISELNYCDYVFSIVKNINITTDEAETADAEYAVVTLSLDETTQSEPVWKVGTHQTEAEELVIDVEADGATPAIELSEGGTIAASTIKVLRKITADQWALISLPFDIDLGVEEAIQVNGGLALYGTNIRIMEYDGSKRATGSVEGYTQSGWVEKTSGTIAANTGFAVVVNPANGAEQTLYFVGKDFTMNSDDKEISLERHESTVNVMEDGKSMDADWNLRGNPMLQSATKGTGYSLYVYDGATDSYTEHNGIQTPTYSPFTAWFVQSDDGFTSMTFSHTASAGASTESNIGGYFEMTINGGEDAVNVTIYEGSSESYVRNEDAMYFAPLNNKISQLYLIDKEGAQIASSVVPAPYNEVKLAYKAAVAGAQTLTVTSVIPGTAVYLVDNEEGTETLMNEGSEYNFTSAAGLNSERFAVKTIIDVTGIEESTAETSSVSAVVTGDAVKIYGATAGETIDVYTVNGVLVSSAVAVEGENEISVPTQGVLIVKVGDEVVKIVK